MTKCSRHFRTAQPEPESNALIRPPITGWVPLEQQGIFLTRLPIMSWALLEQDGQRRLPITLWALLEQDGQRRLPMLASHFVNQIRTRCDY
jgi:hypothetical protein